LAQASYFFAAQGVDASSLSRLRLDAGKAPSVREVFEFLVPNQAQRQNLCLDQHLYRLASM
jgi:hypothetical protein